MFKGNKKGGIIRSFSCALHGISSALMRERNLRIHVAAGTGVLYIARSFALSRAEWAALILTVGLVPVCELFNTAIERAVDLASPDISPVAGAAKDAAAGAVLAAALTAVAVGAALFWDPPVLRAIFEEMRARPLRPALWLGAAFLWVYVPGAVFRK